MVPTGPTWCQPDPSSRSCPWSSGCTAGGGDLTWDTPIMLPTSCDCSVNSKGEPNAGVADECLLDESGWCCVQSHEDIAVLRMWVSLFFIMTNRAFFLTVTVRRRKLNPLSSSATRMLRWCSGRGSDSLCSRI